jgi:hypothetical protein
LKYLGSLTSVKGNMRSQISLFFDFGRASRT